MTQDKRILIAAILSAVVLFAYAQLLSLTTGSKQSSYSSQQSPLQPVAQKIPTAMIPTLPAEETIILESSKLRLEIGKGSAAVRSIVLKDFTNIAQGTPLKFVTTYPLLLLSLGDTLSSTTAPGQATETPWVLLQQDTYAAVWKTPGKQFDQELTIRLNEKLPVFTVQLKAINQADSPSKLPTRISASWNRSSEGLAGAYNSLEAVFLTQKSLPWQRTYLRYSPRYNPNETSIKNVPRGTSFITLCERYFCQSIKPDLALPVSASVASVQKDSLSIFAESALALGPRASATYAFTVYTGPRDFFRLREAGFSKAFSLGPLSQIGLVLMLVLKGIAAVSRNYGVAVILLSCTLSLLLMPFTLISFRSIKKMQELQPKLEQLKRKYARDPRRLNQETFALFREHRVSPLSGCLPMVLQLPVLFALWSAISHTVELRGEPFLWIRDLSLPDRLAKLPFGLDLNLLPILMTAAMYMQTRLSQRGMPQTDKSLNILSQPIMSLVFGLMFYQVPSGLVLYWLTNSVFSLLSYKIARI